MKKYKIEFLGNKEICLEMKNNEISERVKNCNELINLIASYDRKFFKRESNGNIAKFDIIEGKLIYFDHYTNLPVKNTSLDDKSKWKGNFNGGGTLQDLIMCMSIYIESGIPFFYWWARLGNWGYSDEKIVEIKHKGLELGIFTETERYMFWLHSEAKKSKIPEYIEKNPKVNLDKSITVLAENGKENPYWVGEFNFIYIGFGS